MLTVKPRKTVEDYLRLTQEQGFELIWGELLMSPAPKARRQIVSSRLFERLNAWVKARDAGIVLYAPVDVILAEDTVVQPDLLYISKARAGILEDRVNGAPDLVVEIVSGEQAQRDKFVKRDLYARHGVAEYWIVDPDARNVERLVRRGRDLAFAGLFQEGDLMTSDLLPGLEIPLGETFR